MFFKSFFFFFYTIVNHLHGKDVFVGGPPVVQAPSSMKLFFEVFGNYLEEFYFL